ncbi:MAG TPA: HEAT repeat domain-containing protein [Kofleriaceae bacterium]|nr:HEAT repeat domain-containing protein [Kofleriaceae bacterium]
MTPPTPQNPPAPPTTTLEQVTRWAPTGMQVGSLSIAMAGESGIDVPGVELFRISDPTRGAPADGMRPYQVVAVAGGLGKPILDDKTAILRAVSDATRDAKTLARVGLLLGQRDGEILTSASTDAERKANVAAPKLAGSKVEFWILTTGVGRELQHVTLDLTSAMLSFAAAPTSQSDVIANAIASLSTPNVALHAEALRTLAKQCATPAAKQALFDALAKHPQEQTRAAAAEAAPGCGAIAVEPLIHALGHDPARLVRGKAAFALGALGDKKAIPALQKAATTDIAAAAQIALDKLK